MNSKRNASGGSPPTLIFSSVDSWVNEPPTIECVGNIFWELSFARRFLIWDSFACHITDSVKKNLARNNVDVVIIPDGCTKYNQPPDVSCCNTRRAYKVQPTPGCVLLQYQVGVQSTSNPRLCLGTSHSSSISQESMTNGWLSERMNTQYKGIWKPLHAKQLFCGYLKRGNVAIAQWSNPLFVVVAYVLPMMEVKTKRFTISKKAKHATLVSRD